MNHTYWVQKPKGGRRRGRSSTIFLLFDYRFAKELTSTSAKPLENTKTGFPHHSWVLRGWAGIKGTKKSTQWPVTGALNGHQVTLLMHSVGGGVVRATGSKLNFPRTQSDVSCSRAHLYMAGKPREVISTSQVWSETAFNTHFFFSSLAPTVLLFKVVSIIYLNVGNQGDQAPACVLGHKKKLGLGLKRKIPDLISSFLPDILKSQLLNLMFWYLGASCVCIWSFLTCFVNFS